MAGSPHRVVQSGAMDHGVVMFPTEYSIAPDEFARALEERGFESVWFPGAHPHPGQPQEPLARRRASCPASTGRPTIRSWP